MFDQSEHIGELAELYALGDLTDETRAAVDRHVVTCDGCARRLGEAEATILRLIDAGTNANVVTLPGRSLIATPPARPWRWAAAIAAAFLVGLLPFAVNTMRDRATPPQLATAAMLAGHFVHAPFVPLVAGAPAGKAIYAREGGWIYVIVAPGSTPLNVAVTVAGRQRRVATIPAETVVRSAFVRLEDRATAVELLDGDTVVARAAIVYAAPREHETAR